MIAFAQHMINLGFRDICQVYPTGCCRVDTFIDALL